MTTIVLLDERYLSWLYSRVASVNVRSPGRTYWSLLRQLYKKEFVWTVPNDDNRVEDGRDLRFEFLNALDIRDADHSWLELGCSVLELLIGLSRRLAFEAEGEPRDWFWQLLKNLELSTFTDANYSPDLERWVDSALDILVFRLYEPDGTGGLFPLKNPERDQRRVEIWYQLSAYLLELSE